MLRMYLKCVLPYSLSLFPMLFNGGKFILTSTAGMRQCLNNDNHLDDEVILLQSLKQAAEKEDFQLFVTL